MSVVGLGSPVRALWKAACVSGGLGRGFRPVLPAQPSAALRQRHLSAWWGRWHPGALQAPGRGASGRPGPPGLLGREEGWPRRVSARGRQACLVCQGLSPSWALSPFPGPPLRSESHCAGHSRRRGLRPVSPLRTESPLCPWTLGPGHSLWSHPGHCGGSGSIPGPHSRASRSNPSVTNTDVPRHCLVSPGAGPRSAGNRCPAVVFSLKGAGCCARRSRGWLTWPVGRLSNSGVWCFISRNQETRVSPSVPMPP